VVGPAQRTASPSSSTAWWPWPRSRWCWRKATA